MLINAGKFTARLAETEDDIAAAQRLRYRVFVEEMGARATPEDAAARRETDSYDAHCDHLILEDRERDVDDPLDRVVGVYRLLRGSVAAAGPGFYTSGEYDLSPIAEYPGETLELGRSCVDAAYRGGSAMQLLWMGLAQYVDAHDAKLMFGCASFHGTDLQDLAQPLSLLHHKHLAPAPLRPRVIEERYNSLALLPADAVSRSTAMRQMPALIKAYLRLGGFVGDGAFIDHEFNTVDVCLVMETSRIADRYRSFYARQKPEKLDRVLG